MAIICQKIPAVQFTWECSFSDPVLIAPSPHRWRCSDSAGVSCSSWTRLSPLCLCTWLLCWRRLAFTLLPCQPSAWCPSWTRSGSSRTRWTSWTGCRWTRLSTAVLRPSHSSLLVSLQNWRKMIVIFSAEICFEDWWVWDLTSDLSQSSLGQSFIKWTTLN